LLAKDSITIYNMSGKVVRLVGSGNRETGRFTFSWDGLDERGQRVASGIYFYRLKPVTFLILKK
jgi:flagellar hook assembly protein FlgD